MNDGELKQREISAEDICERLKGQYKTTTLHGELEDEDAPKAKIVQTPEMKAWAKHCQDEKARKREMQQQNEAGVGEAFAGVAAAKRERLRKEYEDEMRECALNNLFWALANGERLENITGKHIPETPQDDVFTPPRKRKSFRLPKRPKPEDDITPS